MKEVSWNATKTEPHNSCYIHITSAVLRLLCDLESLTELIKHREDQACWSGKGPRPLDVCVSPDDSSSSF